MYKSKVRTTRRSLYADVIPTEDEEQEALFRWAEAQSATKPWLKGMFAIPNGDYRAKATAARMKRTGTRAGVPDIFLPVSNGREHGLFIEMKRAEGRDGIVIAEGAHEDADCRGLPLRGGKGLPRSD